MKSETRNAIAIVALALAVMPAWAADSTAKTAVGGAIGGAGGAAIGGALGGKTGTVVGGAAGGAVGCHRGGSWRCGRRGDRP